MNIHLFINNPIDAELDLDPNFDITLQYSVGEIQDISKRNSAYSKTLTLPGTRNNNYWFGQLFDVNSDFTYFNPNKKTPAKLLVNTQLVIDGFLQLKSITSLKDTDLQGNEISYECVIYNNSVDFYTQLGELTLQDLDFEELSHTYSAANIVNSWSNTDGYVYPLYGTTIKDYLYKTNQIYPATFLRTILDKMFQQAGYGWDGSLKTNTQFNREIIPYVGDGELKISDEEVNRRLFNVGLTPSEINQSIGTHSIPTQYFDVSVPFNKETTPNFDNGNVWDNTTYEWTVDRNGEYQLEGKFSFDVQVYNPTSSTVNLDFPGNVINFNVHVEVDNGSGYGVGTTLWWQSIQNNVRIPTSIPSGTTASAGTSGRVNIAFTTPLRLLSIGDKVRIRVKPSQGNGATFYYVGSTEVDCPISLKFGDWYTTTAYISNSVAAGKLTDGDVVQIKDFLPEKLKQKDIIDDLIKRYNLYIEVDPNNPRKLLLNPRPNFYQNGQTLDWTSKKDFSQQDKIELLSDLQNKQYIWTYKLGRDSYNTYYNEVTGDIFGQLKYQFDNDFIKGDKKIESKFTSTPLVKTQWGGITPAINPDNPKSNPRILYWGGLKTIPSGSWWTLQSQDIITGSVSQTTYSSYPYAGHYDDPITPNIDINFGQPKFQYYNDISRLTTNHMYNTYWRDYVTQIEEGKLVTSWFYLTENDINFIKDNFNTRIFVKDSYYYVNKIIDFKPLKQEPTKVELIKITDGVPFQGGTSSIILTPEDEWKPPRDDFGGGISIDYGDNQITGEAYINVGRNNRGGGRVYSGSQSLYDNRMMFLGDSNTIFSNKSYVVGGDNNFIGGEKSGVISGDNNIISASNSFIMFADNKTVVDSNKLFLGENIIIDTNSGSITTSGTISASASQDLESVLNNGNLTGAGNTIQLSLGSEIEDILGGYYMRFDDGSISETWIGTQDDQTGFNIKDDIRMIYSNINQIQVGSRKIRHIVSGVESFQCNREGFDFTSDSGNVAPTIISSGNSTMIYGSNPGPINSVIIGGQNHTIKSKNNVIVGGTNNTATASVEWSVIAGGNNLIADLSETLFTYNFKTSGGRLTNLNLNYSSYTDVFTYSGGSPYVTQVDDYIIRCDSTLGTCSVQISNTSNQGQTYIIKDVGGSASTYPIELTSTSSTIDNSVTYSLTSNYESVKVVSDGSEWWII